MAGFTSRKKSVDEQTLLRSGNREQFGLASGILYGRASSATIIIRGLGWGGRERERTKRTRLDWLLYFGLEDLNFVGDICFISQQQKAAGEGDINQTTVRCKVNRYNSAVEIPVYFFE